MSNGRASLWTDERIQQAVYFYSNTNMTLKDIGVKLHSSRTRVMEQLKKRGVKLRTRSPLFVDLSGKKFNKLFVVSVADKRKTQYRYNCLCDCGNKVVVAGNAMSVGNTKSCGCQHKRLLGFGSSSFGQSWRDMKRRVNNKNCVSFKHYGKRGISMDSRWLDFKCFYADMYPGYIDGYSIERIDVNGPYDKENCMWVSRGKQNYNKQNTLLAEVNGTKICIGELAKQSGIPYRILRNRFKRGLNGKDLVEPYGPVKSIRRPILIEYDGKMLTTGQLSKLVGLGAHILLKRYNRGIRIPDLLKPTNRVPYKCKVKKIKVRS